MTQKLGTHFVFFCFFIKSPSTSEKEKCCNSVSLWSSRNVFLDDTLPSFPWAWEWGIKSELTFFGWTVTLIPEMLLHDAYIYELFSLNVKWMHPSTLHIVRYIWLKSNLVNKSDFVMSPFPPNQLAVRPRASPRGATCHPPHPRLLPVNSWPLTLVQSGPVLPWCMTFNR